VSGRNEAYSTGGAGGLAVSGSVLRDAEGSVWQPRSMRLANNVTNIFMEG
jgi:hypothetical protein